MLQLTPSPQRNDSPEMFNPKLRTKNYHLADIMHHSASLVPGLFLKQSVPDFILPFETIHISSPNNHQSSKQELARTTRTGRKRQNLFVNQEHPISKHLTSQQNQKEATALPQSTIQNTVVTSPSLANSWHYSKEVTPPTHKYIIEPISKSLLFQLQLHLQEEGDEKVSKQIEVENVSLQQAEQQQFKDLRQSTSKLQKEPQTNQSNVDIQLFSPIYTVSKREIITSRNAFISDTRISKIKQLLSRKTQPNTTLKMMIVKDTQILNTLWPQYYLRFAQKERALMAAKRTSNALSYTYIISTSSSDFSENSGYYLGKVKSNQKGNVFNVYGPGLNPKNAQAKHVVPRQLIATITSHETKCSASREFKLYLKKEQCHYYLGFPQIKMYEEQLGLDGLYLHSENRQKIDFYSSNIQLQNKKEDKLGNSQSTSNKSIQNSVVLEHPLTREQAVVLTKADGLTTNLSISAPLSPLVGFALALINFSAKP